MVDLAVIAPLGTAALGLLGAGATKLYQALVLQPREQIQALQAELKEEQKDHRRTLIALARLQGKYDRLSGNDSSPPQS
jgi:hypothetical protein